MNRVTKMSDDLFKPCINFTKEVIRPILPRYHEFNFEIRKINIFLVFGKQIKKRNTFILVIRVCICYILNLEVNDNNHFAETVIISYIWLWVWASD